jgi:hypothetical protein
VGQAVLAPPLRHAVGDFNKLASMFRVSNIGLEESPMFETTVILAIGFAVGYAVRDAISRRRRTRNRLIHGW